MQKFIIIFSLFVLCTGCNRYSKLLNKEQAMYNRVSKANNLGAEQKLDSLLASGIRVMEAALKPINPAKGGKIVQRYYKDNQAAMSTIMTQTGRSFEQMNMLEQGRFILKMTQSAEVRKFATMYPQFKRKYNQISAAAGFMDFMGKGLGKFGKLTDLLIGG
jgi:hypothetical protein